VEWWKGVTFSGRKYTVEKYRGGVAIDPRRAQRERGRR